MMEKEKLRFFSRVKLAVTKIEDYNIFLNEKICVGLKYFFLIVFIFSTVLATIETYDFSKRISKAYKYIKNELCDFTYSNGNLIFHENVFAFDSEFNFTFISDTSEDGTNENINESSQKVESQGLILFKDKAVLINNGNKMILDYLQLQNNYDISELNKSMLIEKIDSIDIVGIKVMYFFVILLVLSIFEFLSIFMDCLVLSIFAYCTVKITKTALNYKQTFNISIYSLTLPIILYMIYSIANFAFDFYTEYFKTIYLLIAYVYVVAVIFIIKSDFDKQKAEIVNTFEIKKEECDYEKRTNEDEGKDEKPKDDNKKEDDENDDNIIDDEPDGSEI